MRCVGAVHVEGSGWSAILSSFFVRSAPGACVPKGGGKNEVWSEASDVMLMLPCTVQSWPARRVDVFVCLWVLCVGRCL